MKYYIVGSLLLFATMTAGCVRSWAGAAGRYPVFASVAAETVHVEGDSTAILIGGYGSSMVYHAGDSCFYLLTDRGPNVDGVALESKVFPLPEYAPTIGQFRLVGDSLVLVRKIPLRDTLARCFVGLPNAQGDGVTGETAYGLNGQTINHAELGIDPEGLAIAPDGTFWVSDEYGPFVIQFDAQGVMLRKFAPSKGLPTYYARRRPNRGMEGLTVSKDGLRLYGIMQSPLYLPDESTRNVSVNNRIIEIDISSGRTREMVYVLEDPKHMVSEINFVNDSTMLVLERDGKFPRDGRGFKRVYTINMRQATDVSNIEIEMLTSAQMQTQHIRSVEKTLFVDILATVPGYRHDKPEGMALIGDSVLCVVNDDDFGIRATIDGRYTPKLDAQGRLDKNEVYFIPVSANRPAQP